MGDFEVVSVFKWTWSVMAPFVAHFWAYSKRARKKNTYNPPKNLFVEPTRNFGGLLKRNINIQYFIQ